MGKEPFQPLQDTLIPMLLLYSSGRGTSTCVSITDRFCRIRQTADQLKRFAFGVIRQLTESFFFMSIQLLYAGDQGPFPTVFVLFYFCR